MVWYEVQIPKHVWEWYGMKIVLLQLNIVINTWLNETDLLRVLEALKTKLISLMSKN